MDKINGFLENSPISLTTNFVHYTNSSLGERLDSNRHICLQDAVDIIVAPCADHLSLPDAAFPLVATFFEHLDGSRIADIYIGPQALQLSMCKAEFRHGRYSFCSQPFAMKRRRHSNCNFCHSVVLYQIHPYLADNLIRIPMLNTQMKAFCRTGLFLE